MTEAVKELVAAAEECASRRYEPRLSKAVEAVQAEEKPQEICKHCLKPINWFPNMERSLRWKHSDGYYYCRAETCAEPMQSTEQFQPANAPVHQIGGK